MSKVVVYRSLENVGRMKRESIESLLSECNLINSSNIEDFVNPIQEKYLVCVLDRYNEACAFAELENEDNNINLRTLFVHPHDRGQGHGKELLKCVQKLAKAQNKDFVELVVRYDNFDARALYKKSRFLYDGILSQKVLGMTQFSHNNNYIMGGLLYEIFYKNAKSDFNDEQYDEKFYKYIKSSDKNKVIKNIQSLPYFELAKNLAEKYVSSELEESDIIRMYNCLSRNRGLDEYPQYQNYDKEELKKALLSVRAMIQVKTDEKISANIDENEEENNL